jgi:quercetin dioxygenase-like cupin family protein
MCRPGAVSASIAFREKCFFSVSLASSLTLAEGELVQLPPGQDHSVQAEKESEALLLIVLAK